MSENNEYDSSVTGIRNVIALGFVSLFTDISSEMVFGLLPLFLTTQIGASRTLLGLVEGTGEMVGYTVRMPSGTVSDKIQKRKPLVLIGYSLSTLTKPFFALAHVWTDVFVVRAIDRVGKGIRVSPRDALISDSVLESKVGRAFGIHRSLDQIGAIIGPLIAFALFPYFGFGGIFYFSFIPGAIALFILVVFVKEKIGLTSSSGLKNTQSIFANIKNVTKEKRFIILLGIIGIFSVGAFNFSFILIRASDLGVSQNFIPVIYAVINVAHVVIGFPSGMLSDRIGKEKVLAISYAVFLVSTVFMLLSTNFTHAYILAIVFGTYVGIAETVQRAIIPKYIVSEFRGTAYGLYNLVLGISLLVANFVFGFLLDSSGISMAATYSIVTTSLAIVAIVAFQFFCKRH